MSITLTLIGQSIAFFVFVWICMKAIWPPITEAMAARQKQIADGLAAAAPKGNSQRAHVPLALQSVMLEPGDGHVPCCFGRPWENYE